MMNRVMATNKMDLVNTTTYPVPAQTTTAPLADPTVALVASLTDLEAGLAFTYALFFFSGTTYTVQAHGRFCGARHDVQLNIVNPGVLGVAPPCDVSSVPCQGLATPNIALIVNPGVLSEVPFSR